MNEKESLYNPNNPIHTLIAFNNMMAGKTFEETQKELEALRDKGLL